jgi:hypothetical protein
MNLIIRYLNISRFRLFLITTTCYLAIFWLSKSVLINDIVFYNSFSEQLTYERSMKLFAEIKRLSWMNYVFIPIMLLIKFTMISIVLYIGVFFCDLHDKISFGKIFRIVIACEIVFVFAGFIKFLWFYLFAGNYDLNDINFFYPLSLINLFKISEVNKFWIFPLQSVNVFQVLYILSLSYGLNKTGEIVKTQSDKVVIYSYMPALLFWVVLIMFISIDSSL